MKRAPKRTRRMTIILDEAYADYVKHHQSLPISSRGALMTKPQVMAFNALRIKDMPNGVIIYRGPSKIDGSPIVVIAVGLTKSSTNNKTGAMIQTYILTDVGFKPTEIVGMGMDYGICGNCPHRGDENGKGRTCYVNLGQGGRAVFDKLHSSDPYPIYNPAVHAGLFYGRVLRFGTYGDPNAVPVTVWTELLPLVKATTGYTHQPLLDNKDSRPFLMASCDSEADVRIAWKHGWRTFRVKDASEPVMDGETVCPASEEAGKLTTCIACKLCSGSDVGAAVTRGIVINAHGGFGTMAAWRLKMKKRAAAQTINLTINAT